eukprot:10474958-Prorocentrum_lima.AAC.1
MICQEYPERGRRLSAIFSRNTTTRKDCQRTWVIGGQDGHDSRSRMSLQSTNAQVLTPCLTTLYKEH